MLSRPPRLPLEVLHNVIDTIALSYDRTNLSDATHWNFWDSRVMLRACGLTCRNFVRRARHHLQRIDHLTLRSLHDLTSLVTATSKSPLFAHRIDALTIDASVSLLGQSWVSAVPLLLPLASMAVQRLALVGVDFTRLHPTFHRACTRFGGVQQVYLKSVTYTRYSQIARLLRALRVNSLTWDAPAPTVQPEPGSLKLDVTVHPGPLFLPRYLRDIELTMTWDVLATMLHDFPWEDPVDRPRREWQFNPEWPPVTPSYTTVLEDIVKVYELSLPEQRDSFQLNPGPFWITMRSESPLLAQPSITTHL